MDTRKFDALAKTLATGTSRRSVIGGMFGGALAITGLSRAAGKPAGKVDICHYDDETGLFHLINVSMNAYDAHMAHGDAPVGAIGSSVEHCLGCGVACEGRENATVSCSNGECIYTCNEGFEDVEGTCVAEVTCAETAWGSSYQYSCYDVSTTCTDDGNILSATCQEGDYPWGWYPTEINVNSCKEQNYIVSNCNGTLTCGSC